MEFLRRFAHSGQIPAVPQLVDVAQSATQLSLVIEKVRWKFSEPATESADGFVGYLADFNYGAFYP
jgi:hypothetical protein